MIKRELKSRTEIEFLVRSFYKDVRKDDLIGPIFNNHIDQWEDHIQKLTDFWETNLLFIRKYKGNPLKVHLDVDKTSKQTISQVHFGRWLQLWFQTLDAHFVGENTDLAKNRARNMSTHMFMKIFSSRQHQS